MRIARIKMLESRLISVFQQAGPAEGSQKILLHPGKSFSGDRIAGHQNEFDGFGQFMLMQPETFAQQTAGTAAFHGTPDFFAGHHAEFGWRAVRQPVPIGNETTAHQALAGLANPREVAILRQARGATEAQAFRRFGGCHTREKRIRLIIPASGVCGRRDGDWPAWPCRSCWNCG